MQRRTWLAAIAVVLLAVAALGYTRGWWKRGGAKAPATAAAPAPTAPVTAPAADRAQVAPDRAQLARDDDPVGPLRLEGLVLDADEHGVAGARVAIDSTPPRIVTTETDGSFAIDGLITRDYRVEAHDGDRHAGPVRLRLTATSEPVTLRLALAATVEVTVVAAADNAPVAGAAVELRGTMTWTATTGADGVATLRGVGPTWGSLHAIATGFAPARTMVSLDGTPTAPVRYRLTLVRGAAVSGRVVDGTGAGIADARVVAIAASEPFPLVDLRRDGVTTGKDGAFTIPAVAAGSYRLEARDGVHAPGSAPPMSLDGVTRKSGVVIELDDGGVVRGVVTDGAGAPVAGAEVQIVTRGDVFWRPRRQALTGPDGRFSVGGLARRAHDVVAWHDGGASAIAPADLVAATTVELTLALEITGAISGTVVDRAGEPIGDAQVMAEPVWSGGTADERAWSVRGLQEVVTDPGGGFRIAGLPPGEYRVRAARGDAGPEQLWTAHAITARPGEAPVRIVLGSDGRITGKVAFADGHAPELVAVAIDGASATLSGGSKGALDVRAVAGRHTVVISGPGFVPHTVRDVVVEEGAATDLGSITVAAGRSVSGRVLDGSGVPVAGARVAAGPLLTGGGTELFIETESPGARSTETDADGRYLISGFSPRPITVIAGKDGVGRAMSVAIPRGPDSAVVDLILSPLGSLSGTVTRSGQPLGDTVVIANPAGATSSNFFVVTGADGTFALDQLTAGSYLIYPMIGGGGPRPKDMFMRRVDVTVGARTTVTLDATPGPGRIDVTVATDSGAPVVLAQVVVVQAAVDAANIDQLRDGSWIPPEMASGATVALYLRAAMGGEATADGVALGTFTACAVPLPVRNVGEAMGMMEQVEALPMKCAPVRATGTAPTKLRIVVPAAWVTPR